MSLYAEDLRTAIISASSSGDNQIIAAPTDGYIAIDHINIVPTSSVGLTFKSGSTALSGVYPLEAKQPITLENAMHNTKGVITIAKNTAFNINLDTGILISGFVRYRVVGNS